MRDKFLLWLSVFACWLLVSCFVLAQQPASGFEIKATKISGNIHLLNAAGQAGSMNATVSVGSDGLLLVDGFINSLGQQLRTALKSNFDRPVKIQINTHWHDDHTGPNLEFGRETVVIAHPNVRRRLMTEQKPPWMNAPVAPRPPHAWPMITVEHSLSLHFNGEEIRLFHLPNAHTDGDLVVYFTKSNVVSIGDLAYTVRGELHPSPDFYSNGDAQGLARGLEWLIAQLPADVIIVPGHGQLMTLRDLKAYHRILAGTIDLVRQQLAAGKKLDEIKAQGLPKEFDSLGNWKLPHTRWIGLIYEDLTNHHPPK